MANVVVYNMEGNEVGTIELSDAVFGVEVNEHLVHMAVVQQLANNRQGTQKAKTRSEVYSGVYGRASINLYAFNSNGNKGIACGLNNLQLIRAGEPLGGKASAEADFATDADDDFLA